MSFLTLKGVLDEKHQFIFVYTMVSQVSCWLAVSFFLTQMS